MEEPVVAELRGDLVDKSEPALRSVRHRDRDGAVQRHDRRRLDRAEPSVQERDLLPIRVRLGVQSRDCSLQLIRARARQRERTLERGLAGGDLLLVPQRAVLVGEQHQAALVVDARRAT